MGLDSIWDDEGNFLTKKSKGFRAKSTGCSCCSSELTTENEVKKEAILSLGMIIRASDYFKWDWKRIMNEGKKESKRNVV